MIDASKDAGFFADLSGFAKLKLDARENGQAPIKEVASQFEALFVQMVMKSMRDASLGDGAFDNDQSRMYQDMMDSQLSLVLSKGRGLGLSDLIVKQLGGEVNTTPVSAAAPRSAIGNKQPISSLGESTASFVSGVYPAAEQAAAKLGVAPEAIVAQAALETGWGKYVITDRAQNSSNNLFNIKAGSSWQGRTVSVPTVEYENGTAVRRVDSFRAYDSIEAAFDDYVNLISTSPRYQEALNKGDDTFGFAKALQEGGYATDPKYADKIRVIVAGEPMRQHMADVKNSQEWTLL